MKLPKNFVSAFQERLARSCFELKDNGIFEKLERFSFSNATLPVSRLEDPEFLPMYQYTKDGSERFLIWADIEENAADVFWTLEAKDTQSDSIEVLLPEDSEYAFAGCPFTEIDLRGLVLPDSASVKGMFANDPFLRFLALPDLPTSSYGAVAARIQGAKEILKNTNWLKELYGPGWLRYLNIQDIINTNPELDILDV